MAQRFGDEFIIEEVSDFDKRVEKILPLREWDSVSYSLIWKLQHTPTESATHLGADLWVKPLDNYPSILVFYTIDVEQRTVVLTDVRRLDSPTPTQEEP